MDSNCGLNQCLFNCFLTVIITIAAIAILDIVLYLGYAYFNVQRYYAKDLKRWRNKELAKYGENEGGWEEIAPPSESIKARQITSNNKTLWTVSTDGNIYTCKKPCDGTDSETLWRKYDGNLSQVSASNNGIWGVSSDNNTYSNTTGAWENKGSWTHQPGVGLVNIAMGPRGWVWGVNQAGHVFRCSSQWQCGRDWISTPVTRFTFGRGFRLITRITPVKQVAVGYVLVWALTNDGLVYYSRVDGSLVGFGRHKTQWKMTNVPEVMRLISVGLFDNLYGVGVSNKLYKCINPLGRAQWIELKGAPNLQSLSVNTEMYGTDENGLVWTGELR